MARIESGSNGSAHLDQASPLDPNFFFFISIFQIETDSLLISIAIFASYPLISSKGFLIQDCKAM